MFLLTRRTSQMTLSIAVPPVSRSQERHTARKPRLRSLQQTFWMLLIAPCASIGKLDSTPLGQSGNFSSTAIKISKNWDKRTLDKKKTYQKNTRDQNIPWSIRVHVLQFFLPVANRTQDYVNREIRKQQILYTSLKYMHVEYFTVGSRKGIVSLIVQTLSFISR